MGDDTGDSMERDLEGHRHYRVRRPPGTFTLGMSHPDDQWAYCVDVVPRGGALDVFLFTTRGRDHDQGQGQAQAAVEAAEGHNAAGSHQGG